MKKGDAEFRLVDYVYSLLKHRRLLIILTFMGLGLGIVLNGISYTNANINQHYTLTAGIILLAQMGDGSYGSTAFHPTLNDVEQAEKMVRSAMYVISSDLTINEAVDRLNLLGVSAADIRRNLSVSQYKESQVIEMSFNWDNANEGIQILTAILDCLPKIFEETLHLGNISVVYEPRVSAFHTGSISLLTIISGAAVAFFLGAGYCALPIFFHPTVLRIDKIREMFRLEIIGKIPSDINYYAMWDPHRIRQSLIPVPIEESFTSTTEILLHRLSKVGGKSVLVTSSVAHEGRSGITASIAIQAASMGARVLVVDFDTHHPQIGHYFPIEQLSERNLNAVFRNSISLQDAVFHFSPRLDVLPAVLENDLLPMDLGNLKRVQAFASKYDLVLYDTSPLENASDVFRLAWISDAALFVIRQDTARLQTIDEQLKMLRLSGIPIIGCVANDVYELENLVDMRIENDYFRQRLKPSSFPFSMLKKKSGDKQAKKAKKETKPRQKPERRKRKQKNEPLPDEPDNGVKTA